ncbi:type II toxin-antitoxin system death-on-curing family toxin [Methanomicrobium antiquum]|uniref:Type II toxin-antitoxin system death-on-curing family toxin n=1 Tax=Methanomicrobium antiquum TaxID=487686 RepID=A0AAF0JTT1_9EURY|nr:type II toxin-antitoxin system death-on-curing family toxin [Methanomicrobium antiquum]WFN36733.1 type II toxin-antitoxin system death-on-curing family toxin [Methanomicrobium antiquum]
MIKLSVSKITEIQEIIILNSSNLEDRGTEGLIRDIGTLEYLVNNANYIEDSFEKAAFILHGIASYHPFIQGNKRTALITAEMILHLSLEPAFIECEDEEINNFVRNIADAGCHVSPDDVFEWLRKNSKKIIM